mmetsp:Transcript_41334/g.39802  ORF Transcript_41334/g.39802 Transcript_41334/m.39802 type:complete len:143 (+) Transcript_41334:232-660(+)
MSLLVGLLAAFYVGYLTDKMKVATLIMIVFLIGGLGLLIFPFIEDPYSLLAYPATFGFSILNMCGNVVLYSLLFKNVEKGTRALVLGLHNTFGTIGILVLTKFGTYIYSNWSKSAPFVFVACVEFFYMLVLVGLKLSGKLPY